MVWVFTDWYEKNKDKLAKKRRLKYRLNKDFRADMKRRSKDYYAKKIKKRHPRTVFILEGKTYLTIGGLSKVIRRNEHTIREYHIKGVLPETDRGNARGWRVYSVERVKVLREAFRLFDAGEIGSLKEVRKYIHEKW